MSEGVAYIAAHPEIDTVLITGGDPLMLGPSRLRRVLEQVSDIPHLRIVRIGTKVPEFEPARITGEMFDTLEIPSRRGKQVYLMVHYNHPRELTEASLEVIAEARRRGFGVWRCYPTGTIWRAEAAIRISVCNWQTNESDVDRSVASLLKAYASLRSAQ